MKVTYGKGFAVAPNNLRDAPCENDSRKVVEKVYHESDGLVSLEMRIPSGLVVGKHMHSYSHLSFLSKGTVRLIVEGREDRVIDSPACVNIEKNLHHAIEALTDVVWFCTHATNEAV